MKILPHIFAYAGLAALLAVSTVRAETFSPAVTEALKGLAAEDFAAREKALKQLQLAMGQQVKALVSTDDPEKQTRLVSLLEFNEGLSRWAIETLKLPNESRKAQLAWGMQESNMLVLAKAYSPDTAKRVEAVKELAEDDSDFATAALGRLLDDDERAVYIAAMDAVWDRKLTDAMVTSLWNRAVENPLAAYGGVRTVAGVPIVFRGRNLGVSYTTPNRNTQDAGVAGEVLINAKPPQVAEKLKSFFERAEQQTTGDANAGRTWAFMSTNEAMKNAYRLAELYRTKEVVASMVQLACARVMSRSNGQMGAEKYFWSNRTTPLATVLIITEQNPDDFKLKRRAQVGNMWTSATEADENAAVEKLQEWWKKNAEKYGAKVEAETAETPATQPGGAGKKDDGDAPAAAPRIRAEKIELRINGGINGDVEIIKN